MRASFVCTVVCVHAASVMAATPIDLTYFNMKFADGRSVLEDGRERRRRNTSPDETKVHLHFAANETEFDLDLQLLPSVFTDNAVGMRALEPRAYGNGEAVFTFGNDGYVSGTVWAHDGMINVHREAGDAALLADKHTAGEDTKLKCGVHTEASNFRNSTTTADRRRRAYDQWWGSGACYTGDDVTRAAHMGIAIGYNMWVKVGKTDAAVTEYITAVVQTTNIVVRVSPPI